MHYGGMQVLQMKQDVLQRFLLSDCVVVTIFTTQLMQNLAGKFFLPQFHLVAGDKHRALLRASNCVPLAWRGQRSEQTPF
jgi:hypothetical protein